jgi:hypothetical protein
MLNPRDIDVKKVCNEEVYKEVSERMNISMSRVKDIIEHISSMSRECIAIGKFDTIRYPYLGKLQVNTRYLQAFQNKTITNKTNEGQE